MNHSIRFAFRRGLIIGWAALSGAASTTAFPQNGAIETVDVIGRPTEGRGPDLTEENGAANRLGLESIDLPAAAELISRDEIDARGDHSALSTITRATGFSSSANVANGGSATAVRGFSGHDSITYTYGGTRLYVGAGTVTFPADTWTVERVEVLRGAGSVINGVGAIGATVNYVPKAPGFENISSELAVTGGDNALRRVAVGSGGRLQPDWAYRFDAVHHETDGHFDRGDERRRAVAGTLRYRPAPAVDVKLSLDYAKSEPAPYFGVPLVDGGIAPGTRENNYSAEGDRTELEDFWPRLSVEWQINESTRLRNETFLLKADRHWRTVESYNYNRETGQVDRGLYLEILHDQDQAGNRSDVLVEFDAAGRPMRLNVGAEFNRIDFTHFNNRPYNGTSSVDLFNPRPGRWADDAESRTSKDFTSKTSQYAVFIDHHVELTDRFSLVSGLRHDRIDLDRRDFARSNQIGHNEPAAETEGDFSGTSGRIGGVYRPAEHLSLYVQASEALDPIQSLLSATDPDLALGQGRQYEAGLKQVLWGGRAQYALALYAIEKENLVSSRPGGVTEQVGEQSSKGLEFDGSYRINRTLRMDLNLALTDAEFDRFRSGSGDFSGNTPKNVPEQTANLWLYWNAGPAWQINGGLRHVAERYSDDANARQVPDYTVFDAGIRWRLSESAQLALRGRNLTDEEDFVLSSRGNQWILAAGRHAELELDFHFE